MLVIGLCSILLIFIFADSCHVQKKICNEIVTFSKNSVSLSLVHWVVSSSGLFLSIHLTVNNLFLKSNK